MEMIIDFPGGARVDAHFAGHTIVTDQPPPRGEDGAPTPFSLFLASMGTCAGIYVLGFCQHRGLATDGIRIVQRVSRDLSTGMVDKIALEIQVPPTFPEKYHAALVRSASQCAVKKHLETPPEFEILTSMVEVQA
jgi:ribosomal protein S12 methylthiotransferase accessory factor